MYSKSEEQEFFAESKNFIEHPISTNDSNIFERLNFLKKIIQFHEYRYYLKNDPVISDFEFDLLFKQLEKIEHENPDWITPDSPTRRISSDLSIDFPSVPHLTPMLSLANSYDSKDLNEFDAQVKRLLQINENADIEYAVEPKFDGGSIALVYENDMLLRAATRGNGAMGEEMTTNARAIMSIPLNVPFSRKNIKTAEIRGEVVIAKEDFKKINSERQKLDLALFANPRNTATGAFRMKDPKEVAQRKLMAFMYTFGHAVDAKGNDVLPEFSTHFESIHFLGSMGFKVPEKEIRLCKNIQEVVDYCQHWEKVRDDYPYEIDGMVVKVNNRLLQERAGYTAHHPRWAIAFKFKAKQATTTLNEVTYQVGKIGSITPVAKVEPVQIAGATISSISLHNEDFILEKDLHIGDKVLIERAGDVIPYIVKAIPELRTGNEVKIQFPRYCPVNDTHEKIPLHREEGEAVWRCIDCICGAQNLQKIIFHVSKPAMDIEGLGKSIVERFFELGWIKDITDVYQLDFQKIAQLEGFGEKSAGNLKDSIEKAKNNPLYRLLHSLSIHHLGQKVSKLLAAEIDHILDLSNWKIEDFTRIKDIGPAVAENVMAFFSHPSNIELLQKLESLGVNVKKKPEDMPETPVKDGPLSGKTILFTGTLSTMGRKEAQEKAVSAGARNLSAISSQLNILVAGENAGSKLKKAKELGTVQILTEQDFINLFLD